MGPNDDDNNKQATNPTNRDAAQDVIRGQLDALYDDQNRVVNAAGQAVQGQRTQAEELAARRMAQERAMKDYHGQWQDYYQKYYERYYVGHLQQAVAEEKAKIDAQSHQQQALPEEVSSEVDALKAKIVEKAKTSAKRARGSRHFIPIISAFVVMIVVAFLQYNQVIIGTVKAYVSPGDINPQNIIVDPTQVASVSSEPRLIIPKINVDVPMIYDTKPDHNSQMDAMFKGVAHFAVPGASSVPGQKGNTVFAGHSSNDVFDPGDYKWIFVQLDKLEKGDTIFVNYNSVRYTYTVTDTKVVLPTDVSALYGHDDKPILTLITCTPIGTAQKRLLVFADQVTPDPAHAEPAPSGSSAPANAEMPGNGPSALQRMFGAR